MSRSIAVTLQVRKNSSRCKNKLLRPFASTCLFEIALEKLGQLQSDILLLSAYDDEFFDFRRSDAIKMYHRSLESVIVDTPLSTVYECYRHIDSEYVMFLNPCHAMLQISTIQSALDLFKSGEMNSMTSVVKCNDWIFNKNSVLVAPASIQSGETKSTEPIYRVAHAFHIYHRSRFVDSGVLWNYEINDPYLFEISKMESIDVDDEEDFSISELIYKNTCLNK